ncbi:MAG: DNA alkylation repair protein [Candidatus Cloacimonetes bacterium]|jgi:3-methyladenine DNA glycosylase AlkD|nr:DNA alkylation repair protein [Candidatus Cloacimonadota bacterium]MDD2542897.1 DNA alkylation repair protein [Candidatus Cloacimonadota bacterium]MDD3097069.1 DNA alkylation repair protein [Candidatus Cloacimonadota bacterium]MDD4667299.1 DNA alkylation repair protein [Candidatus Cloacimonadota bacterium]
MKKDQAAFLKAMQSHEDKEKAIGSQRFFRTGPGEYGEGDKFWGLSVPVQRSISREYYSRLSLADLGTLIRHEVHEVRLTTVMMLVLKYQHAEILEARAEVVELFMNSMLYINNWDLVDTCAHLILGDWLLDKDWSILKELAAREHLWTQRIAMIATYAFIRKGVYQPSLEIADILMDHKHDLIHKAVGWMLREVGNRDYKTEYNFLLPRYKTMPRTMLRYAIEKFNEPVRQAFLKGSI